MQNPRYSGNPSRGKPYRRTALPGVVEQHSRRCPLSTTAAGRRCGCSPSYVARVTRDGATHTRSFLSLSEAVAWRESTRGAFRRGELLPPAPPPPVVSLREAAISFVQRAAAGEALTRSRRPFAAQTLAGYEVALRLRALPHLEPRTNQQLGALPVSGIDGRMLQNVVDHIAAHEGAARARITAAALRSVLRHAYDRGLRDELPPTIRTPPPPPRRTRVLRPNQRRTVIEEAFADDRAQGRSLLGPLFTLVDDTGMRISEALGLVWGPEGLDLNGETPRARIARDTTKTDAGARTIPLSAPAAAVLRKHRLATGRPDDGSHVFADERGRPLARSGRIRTGITRISAQTRIAFTPHTFRHTHATELAASGVPAAAAAARLGHADGGVTFLRTYAHPGEAEATAALATLTQYRQQHRTAINH